MKEVGQVYHRNATLTVVKYNKYTNTVEAINDLGAEVFIQEKDMDSIYTKVTDIIYTKQEENNNE